MARLLVPDILVLQYLAAAVWRGMSQDMGLGDPLQAPQRKEIGPHAFYPETSSGSARPRVLLVEHSRVPYDTAGM